MEQLYDTIFDSLSEEGYLETDGQGYWWIYEGKYNVIPKSTFKKIIEKKLVFAKRIDDEATCYYKQSK